MSVELIDLPDMEYSGIGACNHPGAAAHQASATVLLNRIEALEKLKKERK